MFSYLRLNGEAPSKFHQTWLIQMVWARNKRLWFAVQSSTGSNAISTLYGKNLDKRQTCFPFSVFLTKWMSFCNAFNRKCKTSRSRLANSKLSIIHISFESNILICKLSSQQSMFQYLLRTWLLSKHFNFFPSIFSRP